MNRRIARFLCLLTVILAAGAAKADGYQGPVAAVASRDGQTLYVANADGRNVAWVDIASGKVARKVTLPTTPTALALDDNGSRLFVACAAAKSRVLMLDAHSGEVLATFVAGHTATSLAVSRDSARLYVCNRFDNDVSVIDITARRELARVPVLREPIAAALLPDQSALLVANHLPAGRIEGPFRGNVAAAVSVVDTKTHRTSTIALPHGSTSVRGIAVTPDGKHAFVTHLLANFEMVPFRVDGGWINTNVLSVVDVRQAKVVDTVGMDFLFEAAGNPWDVRCSADGRTVCVTLAGVHELCVMDTAMLLSDSAKVLTPAMGVWPIYPSLGDMPWRRVKLGGKGPRGLALAGHKAFAAEYFSDTLAVVDLAALPDEAAQSSYTTPPGSGKPADAAAARAVRTIALGPPPRLTPERRGELLFNDALLCSQHWQSCASCHPDGRVDGLNWDLLNDGEGNPKNTKNMLLSHRTPPAMAEGVRMSAEEAVRSGVMNILFTYPQEADAEAIDAYLKSLRPVLSPHLVDGRLSPAAERGRKVFYSEAIACDRCHPAPHYTDLRSHSVDTRTPGEKNDRFDTPTLIEVWRTAPYLHDGRYATIEELLKTGRHGLRGPAAEKLSDRDLADLAAFVLSL